MGRTGRPGSSEPVDAAGVRRSGEDQPLKGGGERPNGSRCLREAPGTEDDNAVVAAPLAAVPAVEGEEVLAVVGDDRTLVLPGVFEQVGVGQAAQLGPFSHDSDVVAAPTQLFSDHG